MLQIQGAEPATFRLLKELMSINGLEEFHLCGGTSLSLFNIVELLKANFVNFKESFTKVKSFYFCYIEDIKVDFVHASAPPISEFEVVDGIRLWDLQDTVAMKLNAIYGRGSKKDFWDLDEILNHYQLSEIIGWFFKKYPTAFEEGLIMSLLYFEDAEKMIDPISLKKKEWNFVERRIENEVRSFFNTN